MTKQRQKMATLERIVADPGLEGRWHYKKWRDIKRPIVVVCLAQQSGAVEACWAHNPEVRRSKLRSAKYSVLIFH